MRKYDTGFKNFAFLCYRWMSPVVDPLRVARAIPRFVGFFRDWFAYAKMDGKGLDFANAFPCLFEKTATTGFDSHYFYQDIWAFKRICESKADYHVDVASSIGFAGFLSTILKVTFIDIRPLLVNLDNFESKKGTILSLPFENNSVPSLSCLNVAEHIGLGRYGDPLDPLGTQKAAKELSRVLARNGNLYFSLPVGKPRLCFNAHRIHSPQQIAEYFSDLELVEFSGIDDSSNFVRNIDLAVLDQADFACGLFWFRKRS